MKHSKLIFLDYSGTLCFDAVRFGESERLAAALASSGLAALGLKEVDFFWEKVVNPTWTEGSTTKIGYAALLERRLGELLEAPEEELRQAVRRFTDSYFASFRIDRRWEETLRRLRDRTDISLVIATDHYAEATGLIIDSLAAVGIKGGPLGDVRAEPGLIMVANSADLGYAKADRRFWDVLRSSFPDFRSGSVILVDDFGCNEAGGSDYSAWPKVILRCEKTETLLADVFQAPLRVVTFFERAPESSGQFRSLEEVVRELEGL